MPDATKPDGQQPPEVARVQVIAALAADLDDDRLDQLISYAEELRGAGPAHGGT